MHQANRSQPAVRLTALRAMLVVAAVLLCACGARADDDAALGDKVKAAFLVKFPLFFEWPASATNAAPGAAFAIGILGKDPFGSFFDDAVKDQKVFGRPVRVRRAGNISELAGCQVIFFSSSESAHFDELLHALEGKPVLTVADEAGFCLRGGMVNFYKEEGKVRFEINPAAAEKAGLKPAVRLLKLAKIVTAPDADGKK